ncbi:MAG: hypothetical protein ACQES9_10600, partial [Myxococcota bacterium]
MPDDKKKDLKSRLGRRRLRTASRKRLEKQKKKEESPKQEMQRGPSGQQQRMPSQSGETPVASSSGEATPGAAQGGQGAAPVKPENEFNIDPNFGKTSKKMMIIIGILIIVPSIGFGYCTGNRVEQNQMANYAREDAAKILVDVESIQDNFNKLAGSFKSSPATISDWKKNFQSVSFNPDLNTVGRSKLTWIPNPKERKDFMSNLVTYYSNIMTIDYFYNNFVNEIQTQFQKHG